MGSWGIPARFSRTDSCRLQPAGTFLLLTARFPLTESLGCSHPRMLNVLNGLFLLFHSPSKWSLPVCDQRWLEDQHSGRVRRRRDKSAVPPLCGHLGELRGPGSHPGGSSSDGETSAGPVPLLDRTRPSLWTIWRRLRRIPALCGSVNVPPKQQLQRFLP